jgi:polar amino acid transport system substrate-binding protein
MKRHLRTALIATGLLLGGVAAAWAQQPPGVMPPPAPPGAPASPPQAGASPTGAQGSVWNEIMTTKKFRPCMPIIPPNAYKDNTGKWRGFNAAMAEDIAKTLNVELEYVESNLRTMVIDLQTGRCQAILGLVITPARAVAMDFAGPLYEPLVAIGTRPGFTLKGTKYSDLDDPAIRTSVIQGNAAAQRLERGAPKATKLLLPSFNDAALALQAGRADVYVGNIFELLAAQAKTKMFGKVELVEGAKPAQSYAGVRYDDDGRFARFMQNWASFNRIHGNVTKWIIDSLVESGVDKNDLPANLEF